MWLDGSEWDFTRWNDGEPNNYGGNEPIIQCYGHGKWNDISPDWRCRAVYKRGGSGSGTAFVKPSDHVLFRVGEELKEWDDLVRIAYEHKMRLATPEAQRYMKKLHDQAPDLMGKASVTDKFDIKKVTLEQFLDGTRAGLGAKVGPVLRAQGYELVEDLEGMDDEELDNIEDGMAEARCKKPQIRAVCKAINEVRKGTWKP